VLGTGLALGQQPPPQKALPKKDETKGKGKAEKAFTNRASDAQLVADVRPPKDFEALIFARHPDFDESGKAVGINYGDKLIPELMTAGVPNDWWCVDLCFWPNAWDVTADSKRFLDKLRAKFAA